MPHDNNTITISNHGTIMLSGEKPVDLFRAIMCRSALDMWRKTNGRIIPTRGFTLTKGLKIVSEYTDKHYKRTQIDEAIEDLDKLIAHRKTQIEYIREAQ